MKLFFSLSWLWQVGFTLIISLLTSLLVKTILKKFGSPVHKKNITVFVIVLTIYIVCVFIVAYNPAFICPDEFKYTVSDDLQQIIIDEWKGFYSAKVPIFPIYIKVENITPSNCVLVKIKYMYFGSIYWEVADDGIKQIVKPLAE